MNILNYINFYKIPPLCTPYSDDRLSLNTNYPSLNSNEYRLKSLDNGRKFYTFCDRFTLSDGELIIASNNIRDKIWTGCVWGFENIGNFHKNISGFSVDCYSPITNMLCIKNTLFLVSTANGKIQLWSSRSEGTIKNGYCLFLIGQRLEHFNIYSMDLLSKDGTKVATGSKNSLKIWDICSADLCAIHTINYAHTDIITQISKSYIHEQIFVTCSKDKSATLWDYRQPLPASDIYENHKFGFTSIYWSDNVEKNNEIILGDESGRIYCVDIKMPSKFLCEQEIYNLPIRRISFQGKLMVIIGNTILVKVFKWNDLSNGFEMKYVNSDAENYVRDVQWDLLKENEFYTIDWDANLKRHIM